jgi:NAD(P)-dependent dehydrogenase (short-subunit alcohol dehydrogenase family)
MNLEGRVALVTGGARRVGRAISLALAGSGADLVVNYNDSADEAADVVARAEAGGRRAIAVQADVATDEGVRDLVDRTHRTFGRLDILVNSAALFERSPFDNITRDDWRRVIGVNLEGPFFLSQAAAPLLRQNHGSIVNICDLSALQAWPAFAHHAVSKAALLHLTRVLARALAPDVRVNAIIPGTVLPPDDFDGQDHAGGTDRRVVRREGCADDVANAVLYLVHAGFVTGQTIVVDGGRMLL